MSTIYEIEKINEINDLNASVELLLSGGGGFLSSGVLGYIQARAPDFYILSNINALIELAEKKTGEYDDQDTHDRYLVSGFKFIKSYECEGYLGSLPTGEVLSVRR